MNTIETTQVERAYLGKITAESLLVTIVLAIGAGNNLDVHLYTNSVFLIFFELASDCTNLRYLKNYE